MADIFVNSNATGLNDGSDWANAYTSFASSTSAADGDRVIVATTHSEVISGVNTTYTFGSNVSIITSTVSGSNTVTESKATTAQISFTSNNDLTFNCTDGCSIYGMFLSAGKDLDFNDFRTESCKLECGAGGSNPGACSIGTSISQSSWESYYDERSNKSTNLNISVISAQNRTLVRLIGGTISTDSINATNTALDVNTTSSVIADGVDCSGFDKVGLIDGTINNDGYVRLTKMKLNAATTTIVADAATKQGSTIIVQAVDQNSNQKSYNYEYRGTRESDTSIYIDDTGAFQNQSHKFITNTVTKGLVEPLRLELTHGIADFSTAKTLTIEIAQDGTTTNLTDAEVWIEVAYPGANNQTLYDDNRADNTPSATNQPTSTQTWVGLSGTNARQSLSVTTTQTGINGLYTVYLCVAKPSTTLYANPEASVS